MSSASECNQHNRKHTEKASQYSQTNIEVTNVSSSYVKLQYTILVEGIYVLATRYLHKLFT